MRIIFRFIPEFQQRIPATSYSYSGTQKQYGQKHQYVSDCFKMWILHGKIRQKQNDISYIKLSYEQMLCKY